jgi:micrococcal nuclease
VDPRRLTALLALPLGIAPAGCGGDEQTAPVQARTAVVAAVVDGDTLALEDGRRVRLLQIDAPEERTECHGAASARELAELAPRGTGVTLDGDPGLDDVDAHGRVLRYVFVDGRNVNVELVRRGAASPYFFRGDRGRYARELLDAARAARAQRLGFWARCPAARLEPGLGSVTGPA